MTTITLGKTTVSLMNPPNEGAVRDGDKMWKIGRNSAGMVVLRGDGQVHSDFVDGMDMLQFCSWINERAT